MKVLELLSLQITATWPPADVVITAVVRFPLGQAAGGLVKSPEGMRRRGLHLCCTDGCASDAVEVADGDSGTAGAGVHDPLTEGLLRPIARSIGAQLETAVSGRDRSSKVVALGVR